MTLVDVLWLVVILVSALISILRGFVREVFSFAAWVLALVVAARLGSPLAQTVGETIADPQVRAVTAFLLLFFVTLLIASLVGVIAYRLVRKSGLEGTDRSLGLFFGLIRGAVVVGIVVLVVRGTPLADHSSYSRSYSRPAVEPIANFLHRLLPEDFGRYFQGRALSLEELRQRAQDLGDDAVEQAGDKVLDREGLERVIEDRLKEEASP
ncbi:CvpA family protein [Thiohalorhabdus sp.]|uniref:CvpA family protein n=1 Tax=Thiohalorhabdus sp. TaxID=3094134 RepID=UPI002FC38AF7